MYSAYRARLERYRTNNWLILLEYVIFIISMAIIYSVVGMICDLAQTRSTFATENGYCATEFNDGDENIK